MTPFQLGAILMTLVALAGWANVKLLRLPNGVAMLLAGLTGALILFVIQTLWPGAPLVARIYELINGIDFAQTVTGYLLAFLLFAGAMQVDLAELRRRWIPVATLATLGVAGSIFIVGLSMWAIAGLLGIPLSLPWALVFGALISPTDPVAVLATVRHGGLVKSLQAILEGEALFNDGVGIVAFTALVAVATGVGDVSPAAAIGAVVLEALGGLVVGVVAAFVVIRIMHTMEEFAVEVAASIALAMGVYAGAQALGLSGAIAVVGAGMIYGSDHGKRAMGGETEPYMKAFWTLVDEIFNALLFLLLGVEMLTVPFAGHQIWLLLAAPVLVVLARLAVTLPWGSYYTLRLRTPGAVPILTWGGLHGALSLALALSVPPGPERGLLLSITYVVVAFSITVQGLSFGPLVKWLKRRAPA